MKITIVLIIYWAKSYYNIKYCEEIYVVKKIIGKKTLQKIINRFSMTTRKLVLKINNPSKVNFTLYDLILKTQINKNIDLFEDRINEVSEFYNIPANIIKESCKDIKDLNNMMIEVLNQNFQDISTNQEIIKALQNSTSEYVKNLMIGYNRLDSAYQLLRYFDCRFSQKKKKTLNVLDYGCAVADYGLSFALEEYNVTLCDIKGGNLDFACFRFDRRNLTYSIAGVTEDNFYPDFSNFNIIIAGEILEHLPNPLLASQKIYKALPEGGYLWLSDYPFIEKELVGDHLPEAAQQRIEVLKFIETNFKLTSRIANGYMLRRK